MPLSEENDSPWLTVRIIGKLVWYGIAYFLGLLILGALLHNGVTY